MIDEAEVRSLFNLLSPDQKDFISEIMQQILSDDLELVICLNSEGRIISPTVPPLRESLLDVLPPNYLKDHPPLYSVFPCRVHRLDGTPLDIEIINPRRLNNGDCVALIRVRD